MNSTSPALTYNIPVFTSAPGAKTLVVMLHAFASTHKQLADLIRVVEAVYGKDEVDVYAPDLPYQHRLDGGGADELVLNLVADLDRIWDAKAGEKYQNVIFIGHSIGGTILRRVFLAGSLNPPDYSGAYSVRDELWKAVAQKRDKGLPCEWARSVRRLVLLASWDKGWSISDSTSWFYSIGLNILGAWGRVLDLLELSGISERKPGRTMLDARKGAPFIVQTRLLWMAYRRWHNEKLRELYNAGRPAALLAAPDEKQAANPIVVQVIGSQDDFVSPRDQVDRDVEATAWLEDDADEKRYFLLQMEGSDHGGVVDFSNSLGRKRGLLQRPVVESGEILEKRKEIFASALSLPPQELARLSLNPAYFFDRQSPVDPGVTDVVFVMHGIRDDGYWTQRIAQCIKETDEATRAADPDGADGAPFVACTQTYGYFPMGAFIMPWIRRQKVEWFMDLYVETRAQFPRATMHYVGHSNGTYLAASSLEHYPAARFGNIYFAGSVVHPAYDWKEKIAQERVRRFHNARGGTDWVVALLPKSLEYFTDLGGGGFDGFDQIEMDGAELTQSKRYAKGGHSGAIGEGHWPEIAKFIVTREKPFGHIGENDALFRDKSWLFALLGRARIGVPFFFSLAAVAIVFVCSRWMPEQYRRWTPDALFGEWAGMVFLALLASFVAIQFYYWKHTPPAQVAKGLTRLFIVLAASVAIWFGAALGVEAIDFITLDSAGHMAFPAMGATLTLAVCAALVRFVLTKF